MIQDKYNRLIIEKLPKEIADEFEQIKTDTDNFSDEDIVEIYKENFNDLYAIVEKKHPEAIKPKKKIVKKSEKKATAKATTKTKQIDCDDAKKEIKKILRKKKETAQKRADAPKKKASTIAAEKQVSVFKSVLKTNKIKTAEDAKKFAKKIADIYDDFNLFGVSEKLMQQAPQLIAAKFDMPKAEMGGKVEDKKSEFNVRI